MMWAFCSFFLGWISQLLHGGLLYKLGKSRAIFSLSSFSLCLQPSISGVDLDKFRQILLNHCDVNKDGKIQKSELALCLGLKINP